MSAEIRWPGDSGMRGGFSTRVAAALCAALVVLGLAGGAVAAKPRPGTIDRTFGHRGTVVTRVGSSGVVASDAVPAPGGGFLVSANTAVPGRPLVGGRVLLLRYTRAGELVKSFGRRGIAATSFRQGSATAAAMVRQRDGRLVVVGSVTPTAGTRVQHVLVARFLASGRLDRSFGEGGVRLVEFGSDQASATDVAIQHDGSLVVVGTVQTPRSTALRELLVARLTRAGDLDSAFATGGVLRLAEPGPGQYLEAQAVELGAGGAILVGGNGGISYRNVNYPIVARILPNGSPDPSVNSLRPGVALFGSGNATLRDMALDHRTGRIFLTGDTFDESGQKAAFLLAALRPDITLDTRFSADGLATTSFAGTTKDQATSILVDRRGRALLGGTAAVGARGSFAFARFTSTGGLDRTFGRRGRVRVRVGRGIGVARSLVPRSRGRVLAVGSNASVRNGRRDTGPAITLAQLLTG